MSLIRESTPPPPTHTHTHTHTSVLIVSMTTPSSRDFRPRFPLHSDSNLLLRSFMSVAIDTQHVSYLQPETSRLHPNSFLSLHMSGSVCSSLLRLNFRSRSEENIFMFLGYDLTLEDINVKNLCPRLFAYKQGLHKSVISVL
jgi:hypothetical protein